MSPESTSILLGALTVFVGSVIVFAHRYDDKKGKFDEKSKIDELNEVRMAMRSDTTVSVLDNIWHFLFEIDRKMRSNKEDKIVDAPFLKVDILLYDTSTREYFNKLINDLEQTFRDSMNVRNAWDNLRGNYGQLGKVLYLFAAIEGLVGYPLLFFVSQLNSLLTMEQYYLWGVSPFIVAIIFICLIVYILGKISHNSEVYDKFKEKLIDGVRIGK